jgi:heterodisulfide reductase subunit C
VSDGSSSPSLAGDLLSATGLNVAACYQCGKCSAGCPMAAEMTLAPHQMLRLAQLGERAKLLSDPSPWLCLTCETCSARCPNEVDPARLVDGLREIILRSDPRLPPLRLRAFHRSFLHQIRAHGRVFEAGLILEYKLRTGALLDDVRNAPAVLRRGKLALSASTIEGREEVRRIFDSCRARRAPSSGGSAEEPAKETLS